MGAIGIRIRAGANHQIQLFAHGGQLTGKAPRLKPVWKLSIHWLRVPSAVLPGPVLFLLRDRATGYARAGPRNFSRR